jgi:Zn-finger nucleic acid-binding protein
MNCPTCNVNLLITERQGIEIDYCPQCRGVWLDRGELDKIIERSSAPEIGPKIPDEFPGYPEDRERYRDRDRYEDDDRYKKKRKRKGSFLDDLFDF